MSRSKVPLLVLLITVGCSGDKSEQKPAQGSPGHAAPVAGSSAKYMYYTDADLKKIHLPANRTALNPRLYSFFTDPKFKYNRANNATGDPFDFDLGIEGELNPDFWLHPLMSQTVPKYKRDQAFLIQLNKDYPKEIASFELNVHDLHNPQPFCPYAVTRLADNNIAGLLDNAADNPRKMELMRKVLYYLLTR